MEGVKTINIVEDSSVDQGGCVIETDFGEIDARIASQLAEIENRILEISPIKATNTDHLPSPLIRSARLNTELAASSAIMDALNKSEKENTAVDLSSNSGSDSDSDSEEPELSAGASAALTASAALAALATMATKGKREVDKRITSGLDQITRRKSDTSTP